MGLLQQLVAWVWVLALRLAAPFHPKARQAVVLRRGWQATLDKCLAGGGEWAWVHCASMGEFQDIRVAALAIKSQLPGLQLMVTFQSPTGYRQYANHPDLDAVLLLPPDTRANARHFLQQLRPRFALFSRSEIWFNYLRTAHDLRIPTFLACFRVTNSNAYFKPLFRSYYRRCFRLFEGIFCDEATSAKLLQTHGFSTQVSVTGNPRFDRIAELNSERLFPENQLFLGPVVVAGSVGKGELKAVGKAVREVRKVGHWVVVPHEVDPESLGEWEVALEGECQRWSNWDRKQGLPRVLLVDTVGDLPRFYQVADLSIVGGGFSKKGIHNVLEPIAHGVPVATGPNHRNYAEALELVEMGGMKLFHTADELVDWLRGTLENQEEGRRTQLRNYFASRLGASARISASILRHLAQG